MFKLPTLEAGIYEHYKGPLYQVLGYARDANHGRVLGQEELGGRIVVVYFGLQLDGAHRGPRLAVRTQQDFHEIVCGNKNCGDFGRTYSEIVNWPKDAGNCTTIHLRKRFVYLRPEY